MTHGTLELSSRCTLSHIAGGGHVMDVVFFGRVSSTGQPKLVFPQALPDGFIIPVERLDGL